MAKSCGCFVRHPHNDKDDRYEDVVVYCAMHAAAPRLVRALRAMHDWVEQYIAAGCEDLRMNDGAMQMARSALKKAGLQ
jgi:hypothetical protein